MAAVTGDGGGLRAAARIPALTLQFHPNWPARDGRTVIEAMALSGTYLSQFVTGTSNGGLTAHPGGDRWRWESRLFGGRYDEAPPEERPVYGTWNRHAGAYGGGIRFGSAYVRLRPKVVDRATFCFPDSTFEPAEVVDVARLGELCASADAAGADALDDYVEAHVHGGVQFDRDAEAVVLDPCFAGTEVERFAEAFGCAVEFHPGFAVASTGLDPDYRGAEVVALAQELGERLTPEVVGRAACSRRYHPQRVKQVWHYLARFGRADGQETAERGERE